MKLKFMCEFGSSSSSHEPKGRKSVVLKIDQKIHACVQRTRGSFCARPRMHKGVARGWLSNCNRAVSISNSHVRSFILVDRTDGITNKSVRKSAFILVDRTEGIASKVRCTFL